MFGSLVIVFPTPHEGGALNLRHRGHEWIFDSAKALAAEGQPSIGYVAFFSDIEHEVAPVISGHRITLTYNLYFDDISANDAPASKHLTLQPTNERLFREAFAALLENPEFLAEGGTLAFWLRHVYPIKKGLKHVHSVLKGSDAVVCQSVRALGYEPALYLYYDHENPNPAMIIDRVFQFEGASAESEDPSVADILLDAGGIVVSQEGMYVEREDRFGPPEQLEWVTRKTEFNQMEDAYARYGNEPTLGWAYGDVCLIVRIGKAGDRLGYPTAAEVEDRAERERRNHRRDDYGYF